MIFHYLESTIKAVKPIRTYETKDISYISTGFDETDKSTKQETMKFPNLKIRILDYVAELTISRPESLNSLNDSVLFQLESMVQKLEIRDDVRVLIITGESRSFVSGADIS